MLSRLTNAVLMLAVIALTVALWRAGRVAPAIETTPLKGADVSVARDVSLPTSDDVLILSAAFAPFDAAELDQSATESGASDQIGPRDRRNDFDHPTGDRRDSGRDRRWGGSSGDAAQLTEEMATRCLEVAREVDPEIAKRLSDARANDPEEFDRQMRAGGFGRRLLALAQLKTHDPLLYSQKISELSWAIDIDRTARELRELKKDAGASLGRIAELETNLRTLLQFQLAMSIKARGDMICRFEERLQRMKDDIDREAQNFQSTIDARMRFLLDEPASGDQPVLPAPAKEEPATSGG